MKHDGPLLALRQVSCTRPAALLREITLTFAPGSVNCLVGELESALLLLRIASLQDVPDSGEVLIDGKSVGAASADEREQRRNRQFGFLYSAPYVLPGLSVAENVAMPLLRVLGIEVADASQKTREVLEFVGLADCLGDDAATLSRLDQHRLAVARAVGHDPNFLVLDRADANLPPDEAAIFRQLVGRIATERMLTVLIAGGIAHPHPVADRVFSVEGGVVSELNIPANS